jgi:hypothetical protein
MVTFEIRCGLKSWVHGPHLLKGGRDRTSRASVIFGGHLVIGREPYNDFLRKCNILLCLSSGQPVAKQKHHPQGRHIFRSNCDSMSERTTRNSGSNPWEWALGGEEGLVYCHQLGEGNYGTVHKVRNFYLLPLTA